jgi:hypothetical protein
VQVTDLTTSLIRLFASGDFTGSGSFGVIAGHRYRVVVNATSASASAGEVLSTYNVGLFSVPSPAGAALLGLAGLVGRTRRR